MENKFVVIGKEGSEIKLKDEVLRLSDSDHKQDGFMSPCDEKDIKFYHESYPDGIFYVKSQPEIVYPSDEEINSMYPFEEAKIDDKVPYECKRSAAKDMVNLFKSLNQNRTSVQALASSDNDNWVKVETPPEYEKDYLCFVEITQECGTIWERQQVLHFSFFPDEIDKEHPYGTRRFNTDKDVRVIKWQELPQPPLTDK